MDRKERAALIARLEAAEPPETSEQRAERIARAQANHDAQPPHLRNDSVQTISAKNPPVDPGPDDPI
jgi:hypothetical protein